MAILAFYIEMHCEDNLNSRFHFKSKLSPAFPNAILSKLREGAISRSKWSLCAVICSMILGQAPSPSRWYRSALYEELSPRHQGTHQNLLV